MIKRTRSYSLLIVLSLFIFHPALAEKISLKLSLNTNFINNGDINTWVESFNSLWTDWQNSKGGQLHGEFAPIHYGNSYELEFRFPIVAGFAFNLSGTRHSSQKEGEIFYVNEGGDQEETHSINNKVTAIPIKIGFSYSMALPYVSDLYVNANIGRHIVFVQYKNIEKYEAIFSNAVNEFSYWFEKDTKFNSESLGFYASLGLEYDLVRFLAFTAEVEKVWSNVDGFKGPFTYRSFDVQNESGKASLYYYESNQWDLNRYFSTLSGHEKKPQEDYIRNIRLGKLNFSGISLKIGIRFKF